MAIPCILVTGANGQVGKELQAIAKSLPQYRFVFLSREDLPIHHTLLAERFFEAYHPTCCINCAAYTAVDRAEDEKALAFQINADAVGGLAALCKKFHTRFIHLSTDYVFDGSSSEPYVEEAATGPINTYGASKLEGERLCMQENPEAVIVRTSWVYASHGKNFVRTMIRLMSEKNTISVVNDQIGAPTYAGDLASVLFELAIRTDIPSGIYHYCNRGNISWYEFALEIKQIIHSDCVIQPIATVDFPTPARRPTYSLLNTKKIESIAGIELIDWKRSLRKCIELIQGVR